MVGQSGNEYYVYAPFGVMVKYFKRHDHEWFLWLKCIQSDRWHWAQLAKSARSHDYCPRLSLMAYFWCVKKHYSLQNLILFINCTFYKNGRPLIRMNTTSRYQICYSQTDQFRSERLETRLSDMYQNVFNKTETLLNYF